jgi:tetratricopeptide (TPR) repeat protein
MAGTELTTTQTASQQLESLKQNPTYDANYFYNLGVIYGKLNQPGLANAYLEKANRVKPHDPETLHNLNLARTLLKQQLAQQNSEISIDGASNQFEQFADRIQGDEILGVIGLITVLVSLFWIRAYLKTRNITKTFLKPSGWFGVLALVLVFAFYGIYKAGNFNPPAIVILKQPLRSGPGLNYPEITPIETGIKVRMVGSAVTVNDNELWQKVRYKTEQTAWIPLSSLLPL